MAFRAALDKKTVAATSAGSVYSSNMVFLPSACHRWSRAAFRAFVTQITLRATSGVPIIDVVLAAGEGRAFIS
jgi:hypothetical protein